MAQLDDVVLSVVQDFLKNEVLFTALDVSNKVKEVVPSARHRQVRDVVRALYVSEIEVAGYGRTPITVTLSDGCTQAEALLYHPLSDSWDLDFKYDLQKRNQTAVQAPVVQAPVVSSNGTTATVSSDGTVSVTKVSAVASSTPVVAAPPVVDTSARSAWENLFSTQPSLFPRKS